MRSAVSITGLAVMLGAALLGSSGKGNGAQPAGAPGSESEKAASAQQVFDEFVGGTLTNCFFKYGPTGRDPLNNRAFPDAGAIYWAAVFVRPPGSKVEMEGVYPNSRFMSFISYDKAGLFVDGTSDYMINPDSGSVNTFRNGANRYATPEDRRRYTVEVRLDEKPADLPLVQNAGQPPRNYLYSLPSKNRWYLETGEAVETILYRIYVPDRGFDYAGGEPVPSVKLTLTNGTRDARTRSLRRPEVQSEVSRGDFRTQPFGARHADAPMEETLKSKGRAPHVPCALPRGLESGLRP